MLLGCLLMYSVPTTPLHGGVTQTERVSTHLVDKCILLFFLIAILFKLKNNLNILNISDVTTTNVAWGDTNCVWNCSENNYLKKLKRIINYYSN